MEKNYVGLSKKGKSFWGPLIWGSIHTMAISYVPSPPNGPPYTRYAFENYIKSIAFLLPCPECRVHFVDNLEKNPLTEESFAGPVALFTWTWKLHNIVNESLGKKKLPFADAYDYWSQRM